MKCDELAAGDVPAQYLLGALAGVERDAYEAHYFECDRCFRELETLRAAQAVLARESRSSLRVRPPARLTRWLPIAAAVVGATTAAVWWRSGPITPPGPGQAKASPMSPGPAVPSPPVSPGRPELLAFARFEPPRYDPPRLRGPSPEARGFDRAMADYGRGDFAGAIPRLENAIERQPADLRAAFFLGVSFLATDQPVQAIRWFERVTAAGGSAYEEEAWFLRAKAEIRRGEVPAAIVALDHTVALRGDREDEARDLRARLLALTPSPR